MSASAEQFLAELSDDHPIALAREADLPDRPSAATRAIRTVRRRQVVSPTAEVVETGPRPECSSCHQVHAGPDPVFLEMGRRDLCLDCHDTGAYLSGHTTPDCLDCHSVHGGSGPGLLTEPSIDLLCRSCHEGGETIEGRHIIAPPILERIEHLQGRPTVVRAPVLDRLERFESEAEQAPAEDCLECHTVHGG